MEFRINLKPNHVSGFDILGRGRSKNDILKVVIANTSRVFCSFGDGHMPRDNVVRVYSLEKHRKVVKVLDKPIKWSKKQLRANGFDPAHHQRFTKREIVKPAHWAAVYYDIPVTVLDMMGMKVTQGERTWKMVPR